MPVFPLSMRRALGAALAPHAAGSVGGAWLVATAAVLGISRDVHAAAAAPVRTAACGVVAEIAIFLVASIEAPPTVIGIVHHIDAGALAVDVAGAPVVVAGDIYAAT